MSKLIDKEQLAKLAQGLDARMKAAVKAEEDARKAAIEAEQGARAAAVGAVDGKADKNAQDIAAINDAEAGILAQAKAHAKGLVDAEKERADAEEKDIRADFAAADDALKAALQKEIDDDVKVEADRAIAKENEIVQAMADEQARVNKKIADDIKVEEEARAAAVEAEKVAREAADNALSARVTTLEGFFGEGEGGSDVSLAGVQEAIQAAQDAADQAQGEVDALELVVEALDGRVETAEGEIDALQGFVQQHDHSVMEQGIAANKTAVEKEVEDREAEIERVEGVIAQEVADREAAIAEVEGAMAAADAQVLADAKAHAEQKIADLVDSAPEAMNTLNELATAIKGNKDIYDAYIEEHATAMSTMEKALKDEIDADVLVETNRAKGEEGRIEGLVNTEAAKAREEEGKLSAAIGAEQTRAEAAEGALAARVQANEAFVAAQPAKDQAQDQKIQALEQFVAEHSHEGLQGEIDAVEGRVDALEAFKNAHSHATMEQGIADNAAAIAKEVEDRNKAIEDALKAYSTTEEMKTVIGNVVNSLALTMENDKVVLKLGGVDGIALTSVSLDVATEADIQGILNGLDA